MIAGSLEIQMSASLARLSDDMKKTQTIVGSTMKNVESSVASAKKVLGALGIGLGVGYFVTLIKGSIDAMDRLRDLSKTTNITVESLAGLKLAAQQSGGDLNSIADSINKLSQNMGKDADKFRLLGVTAKEPLEAFKQLADIYTKLEDPQQRAAVMAQALGKSWAGAAPLLAEGSFRIQEMVDKGTKLSGVTKDMADQADALMDKWAELTGTGRLMTGMIGPMLPLLNMLADDLLRVQENSEKVNITFDPMAETLRVMIILWGNFAFTFTQFGIAFAGVAEQISAFSSGGWKAFIETRKMVTQVLNEEREAFDAWEKKVLQVGKNSPVAPGGAMDMGGSGNVFGRNKGTADAAAAFLGGGKGKGAEDPFVLMQQLEGALEEARIQMEADELSRQFLANQALLEEEQRLYDERNAILIEAYDREQAEAIANGEQVMEIERSIAQQKKLIQAAELQGRMTFLNNMAGLMNTQSKKVFEFGKMAAISQAAYKGGLAVMDAWEAGMSTGGPWAPVVAAAYAAAAGAYSLNLINNIRSQEFGGGGGGVPIAPSQGASNISPSGFGGGAQPNTGQTTIINMPPGQFFDRKTIQQLIEGMNENRVDGSRFVIAE